MNDIAFYVKYKSIVFYQSNVTYTKKLNITMWPVTDLYAQPLKIVLQNDKIHHVEMGSFLPSAKY